MSRYEETTQKFRTRASWVRICLFSTFAVLLSRQVAAIFGWGIETALAWSSGWTSVLLVYAPFGVSPSVPYYSSPPLMEPFALVHLIVPAAAIGVAILLAFLWPTSPRLASRLFTLLCSIELVRTLAIAPAAAALPVPSVPTAQVYSEMTPHPAALILLVGALTSFALVVALIRSFGSSLDINRVGDRTAVYLAAIAWPFSLAAVIELLLGYSPGLLASGAVLLCGLVSIRYGATGNWPPITNVSLRRASVLIPLTALLVVGSSLYIFRGKPTGSPARALFIGKELRFVNHDEILRRQLRDPQSLQRRQERTIEWSDSEPDRGTNE